MAEELSMSKYLTTENKGGLIMYGMKLVWKMAAFFGVWIALCLVAIAQSAIALPRAGTGREPSATETVVFTFLYLGFGFLGIITAPNFIWQINSRNLLELLPILGALSQMISVFVPDEQNTRKWLLCNAVFWVIYSAAVGSSVVVNDLLAVISTSSALYKYRKKKK